MEAPGHVPSVPSPKSGTEHTDSPERVHITYITEEPPTG